MRTEKQELMECLNSILLKGGLTDLQKEALSFAMKQVASVKFEKEIRKEIKILKKHESHAMNLTALAYFQTRILALKWVLSESLCDSEYAQKPKKVSDMDGRRLKKESPTMEKK